MFLKGKHQSSKHLACISFCSQHWAARLCGSRGHPHIRFLGVLQAARLPSPLGPHRHRRAQPGRPSYLETDSRRFSWKAKWKAMLVLQWNTNPQTQNDRKSLRFLRSQMDTAGPAMLVWFAKRPLGGRALWQVWEGVTLYHWIEALNLFRIQWKWQEGEKKTYIPTLTRDRNRSKLSISPSSVQSVLWEEPCVRWIPWMTTLKAKEQAWGVNFSSHANSDWALEHPAHSVEEGGTRSRPQKRRNPPRDREGNCSLHTANLAPEP